MAAISLPRRCDRAAALRLHGELVVAVGSHPIEIDGSEVEQIDQATLQLLLSARRSGGGAVIKPSPAMMEAGRLTGLSEDLFSGATA